MTRGRELVRRALSGAAAARTARAEDSMVRLVVALLAIAFLGEAMSPAAARAASANVARATLTNGLRVIAVRDTLAPAVTTEMNYLVGSQDDPPDVPGMAHAQEHMLFRGSAGVSGAQLASMA